MRKVDRLVQLALGVDKARAEVDRLEAELEALMDGRAKQEPPAKKAAPVKKKTRIAGRIGRPPGPQHAQIIALGKEGLDARAVAERLGCSKAAAYRVLHRAKKNNLLTNGVGA